MTFLVYFFLFVTSSVVSELSLFMNETETRRLLGVPGELYYVRNGYINEYALSFNQLLKPEVAEIYFNWFDESSSPDIETQRPLMDYSMTVSVSNMHAMYQPQISIPSAGTVPTQRSGFSVSVLCTGLLSTDVEMRLQINVSTAAPYRPLALNIRRKKSCLRGIQQAPRPLSRHNSAHPLPITSSGNPIRSAYSPSTPAPLVPGSSPELDDAAGSVVFYASIGGALASVVVMATVIIVCYLATVGRAKNLDHSQSSSVHAKMISGGYESGTLISNHGLINFDKSDSSSFKQQDCSKYLVSKKHEVEVANSGDVYVADNDLLSVFESVRIEPCRLRITETLLDGTFSALCRAKLISATPINQLIEDDVLVKTFIPADSRRSISHLESMMRDCRQLVGLHDDNLCPVVAASCFIKDTLSCPYWLVYGCSTNEQCLKIYFDQRQRNSEACLNAEVLLLMATQLTAAVQYLHFHGIVHRDIAARNCTVDTSCMTVRLADGALTSDLFPQHYFPLNGGQDLIPVKWTSLEILEATEDVKRHLYTTASDMWSLGVAVWEIMTSGLSPYAHVSELSVHSYLTQGHRLPQPHSCSLLLYSYISSCWLDDPRDRPSASQLHARLQHSMTSRRQC